MSFTITDATPADVPAIAAILNDAIATSTASWHEHPRDEAWIADWLAVRQKDYVVLVARDADDVVLGYASYGSFRGGSGYHLTVEHSIYVDQAARRRGIGKALLGALLERAKAQSLHAMIGGIDSENPESIALHAAFGFRETGRLPEAGRKFDRWLTLVFLQKLL